MRVVTAEEMRQIDKQTIEEIGVAGIVLMEAAATAVFRSIKRNFPGCRHIGVIVGKGNNGGDGLALARQLAHKGYSVQIVLVSSPEKFTGDALTNLQVVRSLGLSVVEILSESELKTLGAKIDSCDLIVDAIFGTGLRGGIEGYIKDVIEWLNSANRPIVAIDLPSGLNADTGLVEGGCICADRTVTLGLPKRGTLLYPGSPTSRRTGGCGHRLSAERSRIARHRGQTGHSRIMPLTGFHLVRLTPTRAAMDVCLFSQVRQA